VSPCGDVSVIKVTEAAKLSELVRTYVHGLCKKLEIRIMCVNCPLGLNDPISTLLSSVGISPQSDDTNVYFPYYSHCAIPNVNEGLDEGPVNQTACGITKQSQDSALKITFNGNLRITDCSDCCARWFVTIDGLECSDPIEGVVYSVNGSGINIHRASVISGLCGSTSDGAAISAGRHIVVMNVGQCTGFNETFNAYTGFSSVSTVTIEEIPTACECRLHHAHAHMHTHTHTQNTHVVSLCIPPFQLLLLHSPQAPHSLT